MDPNFILQHNEFLDSLSNNPGILIENNSIEIAVGMNKPHKNGNGWSAPVLRIYQSIKSLKILWRYNPDGINLEFLDKEKDFVEGEFKLVDYDKYIEAIQPDWLMEEFNLRLDKKFRVLYPVEELNGEYIVCINSQNFNELVYLDLDNSTVSVIQADFETYLKCGYRHNFFYGWQKALFLDSKHFSRILNHYLPQLFPKNFK